MWLEFPSLQRAAVILVKAKIVCHFETSVICRIKAVGENMRAKNETPHFGCMLNTSRSTVLFMQQGCL